jgi:hypothetical protein
MVMIQGVHMSQAAAECVRETSGADVAADVAAIRCEIRRSGVEIAESNLRAHCLDGAKDDRVDGWLEYVAAVMGAAQDEPETVEGYWPSYTETDATTEEWHDWLVSLPHAEEATDLASIVDVCASARVTAELRDAAGFVRGHVDTNGDYRLA